MVSKRVTSSPEAWERHKARSRAYKKAHPEERKAYAREWYHKNKHKHKHKEKIKNRRTWLKIQYGMTLQDYDAMLAKQGGVCAIHRGPNNINQPFHVDHDHKTGKVRGLLCNNCNTILGHAKDSILVLEAAIRYLEEHNGTEASQD